MGREGEGALGWAGLGGFASRCHVIMHTIYYDTKSVQCGLCSVLPFCYIGAMPDFYRGNDGLGRDTRGVDGLLLYMSLRPTVPVS